MPMISSDITSQMNEELKLLVAAGLYKSRSEALRDAIRTLTNKYRDRIVSAKEARKKMDEELGDTNVGDLVTEMREEEIH